MTKQIEKEIKEIKRLLNSEEFLKYEIKSEGFFNEAFGFLEKNKLMMVDYFVMKEQDALKEMERKYLESINNKGFYTDFSPNDLGIDEMKMIEISNEKSVKQNTAKLLKFKK